MDRDCNRCVYSTREGGCRKFTCEGTKTVEDIRAEVLEEYVKLFIENALIDESKTWTEYARKVAEQLKENKNG